MPERQACVCSTLQLFTSWTEEDLKCMRRRHIVMLAGALSLSAQNLALLLGIPPESEMARLVFYTFGGDKNKVLVDALEVLATLAMISGAALDSKVDFVHNLMDFTGTGRLNIDECVMLIQMVTKGGHRADPGAPYPPVDAIERACKNLAESLSSGEIERHSFDVFICGDTGASRYLQFWAGGLVRIPLAKGEMWEDPDFPASSLSLYRAEDSDTWKGPDPSCVQWIRCPQIAQDLGAVMNLSPGRETSLVQGALATGWIMNAVALLAETPYLLKRLFVPTGQEASGRYCIRVYKQGVWENVFIDNRLCCGPDRLPLFARSDRVHELWPCLLEKAYAKMHGCYNNICRGDLGYALRDLSGGWHQRICWDIDMEGVEKSTGDSIGTTTIGAASKCCSFCIRPRSWLGEKMQGVRQAGGLVGVRWQPWSCQPWDPTNSARERRGGMKGLLPRLIYPIQEVVNVQQGLILVLLCNPWAKGSYRGGVQWQKLCAENIAADLMARTPQNSFWMTLDEVCDTFNTLDQLTWVTAASGEEEYSVALVQGNWKAASPARGQLLTVLPVPGEEEKDVLVRVTLTVPDSRFHDQDYNLGSERHRNIGFVIVADLDRSSRTTARALSKEKRIFLTDIVPSRDVDCELSLAAGRYIVIPLLVHTERDAPLDTVPYWLRCSSCKRSAHVALEEERTDFVSSDVNSAVGELLQDDTNVIDKRLVYNQIEENLDGPAYSYVVRAVESLWASAKALEYRISQVKGQICMSAPKE
jgi:hypothetical protein